MKINHILYIYITVVVIIIIITLYNNGNNIFKLLLHLESDIYNLNITLMQM